MADLMVMARRLLAACDARENAQAKLHAAIRDGTADDIVRWREASRDAAVEYGEAFEALADAAGYDVRELASDHPEGDDGHGG